eukprot:4196285-Pyramimonas_sp.AAC.1
MTGPVPPHVEAVRNQRENTLRYVAEFVEDRVFALLSNLSRDDGTFDQAREFLRAEFHSDDIPEGLTPQSFKCLIPLVVGGDDPNNPAALGSTDLWRPQIYRVNEIALHIGICAAYLARHCSDYARSSGGWVYLGDLVEKIAEDGFSYQTCLRCTRPIRVATRDCGGTWGVPY